MVQTSKICFVFMAAVSSIAAFQTFLPVQIQRPRHSLPFLYAAPEDISIADLCDDNHKEILFGDKPVLIDVYAKWCGPCKLIDPMIKRCAEKYANEIDVVKFDVEPKNNLVKMDFLKHKLLVRKLPSLILYKGGKAVAMLSGLMNEGQVDKLLEEHVLSSQEEEEQETTAQRSGAGFLNLATVWNRQD